jgi:F0F1-type ATP synthase epsilon subunit
MNLNFVSNGYITVLKHHIKCVSNIAKTCYEIDIKRIKIKQIIKIKIKIKITVKVLVKMAS